MRIGYLKGERLITPWTLGLAVLLLTLPLWIGPVGLYQYLGVEVLIWIIYALGFNLLLGYGGLPSFGHGAFFGIGAYAFGLMQHHWGAGLVLGLLGAIVAGGAAGGLVAAFLSQRRGIYFALLSIAFGQIFWFVAIKWRSLTGGEDGLQDIDRPSLSLAGFSWDVSSNQSFYVFILLVLAAVVALTWRLVHSRFGMAIRATQQNELRARFLGYRVWLIKWSVFTLSTAIAGLAGGLFAVAQESAYPDVMNLHASGIVVMMVLIGGGLVSFWGPVIGVAVYFVARDVLGAVTDTWLLWYGLMFVLVILFKPEGIMGMVHTLRARGRGRSPGAAGAARAAEG